MERDLEKQLDELKNEVEFLRLENAVYTQFLEKKKFETMADEEEKKKTRSTKRKNYPTVLTSEQKFQISYGHQCKDSSDLI